MLMNVMLHALKKSKPQKRGTNLREYFVADVDVVLNNDVKVSVSVLFTDCDYFVAPEILLSY